MGCSPVYWGTRKVSQLIETLQAQEKAHYLSSREIIDQIILAYQGKIIFKNKPMLLRDETNIDYKASSNRHDKFNYFPNCELDILTRALEEVGGKELKRSTYYLCDKYTTNFSKENSSSPAVQQAKKHTLNTLLFFTMEKISKEPF